MRSQVRVQLSLLPQPDFRAHDGSADVALDVVVVLDVAVVVVAVVLGVEVVLEAVKFQLNIILNQTIKRTKFFKATEFTFELRLC